jgi:mannose-6-phosphate isomerase-like protein (cupin superfamily)
MLIKKEKSQKKQIAKKSFVFEYNLNNKELGFAYAKINGRFPDSGRTINKVCQEIYYVISGSGKIFLEGKEFNLEKGDVFLIDSGKRYYVIGTNIVLACPTVPEWYSQQQEFVE